MPTSSTTAPSRTQSPWISRGTPTAATMMSSATVQKTLDGRTAAAACTADEPFAGAGSPKRRFVRTYFGSEHEFEAAYASCVFGATSSVSRGYALGGIINAAFARAFCKAQGFLEERLTAKFQGVCEEGLLSWQHQDESELKEFGVVYLNGLI